MLFTKNTIYKEGYSQRRLFTKNVTPKECSPHQMKFMKLQITRTNLYFLTFQQSNGEVSISMDQALIRRNDMTDDYLHSRANAMQNIESTIVELGGIFSQLAHMIKEQVRLKLGSSNSLNPNFRLKSTVYIENFQ